MNPQEEYIRRYNLGCPLIKRPSRRCYVVAKAPKDLASSGWIVMHVDLVTPGNKPTYYNVKWYQPTHSSLSGQMASVLPDDTVQWDEYESYMLRVMQKYATSLAPIGNPNELTMALWEMLIFCCDEHFMNMPFGTQQLIWKSIDTELPIEERLRAQLSCIPLLRKIPNVFSRWDSLSQFGHPGYYANWFADVFEKTKEESYRKQFCQPPN